MTPPRRRLVNAVRSHADAHHEQKSRNRHYGTVLRVSPLEVEITDLRVVLDDEDSLVVTQWVRRYAYEHGLKIGDTVVVDRMPDDSFLVSDVVSVEKAEKGESGSVLDASDPTFTGTFVDSAPLSGSAPAGGGAISGSADVNGPVAVEPSHHITKKVAYLDAEGNILGWLPIYGSLPA